MAPGNAVQVPRTNGRVEFEDMEMAASPQGRRPLDANVTNQR
jgi:hypothetical protein